jgi:mannosyltransferase OCH1-like enzyme
MVAIGRPASPLGGRLPKQIQRALPIYIALITLIVLVSNVDHFRSSMRHRSHTRRGIAYKPTQAVGETIPKKIWQTWKVDALSFEERDLTTARTWTAKNPGHRYEALTDNNDMYYVETHFGPYGLDRPDIVQTYRSLTTKIIKADLLRYLVMYVEGGVYTDIDVEALKPVERFIPDRYDPSKINMVIGIEIDQPEFKNHTILGQKCMSFCQWTFMCKPRLPVMMRLIENIMSWLNGLSKEQGVSIGELQLDFDEVISGTGPSAFTAAVLTEMGIEEGGEIEWDVFHNMPESKLVGGVLVLTVEAFAAGQGHSDSGNHNARTALVKHHYHASGWPSAHPRYTHPVYGEVEKCNWEAECVKLWDFNKAAFDGLSPEDQAKQIAFKEAADAQAAKQAEDLKNLKAIQEANLEKFVAAEKAALAKQAAKAASAGQGGAILAEQAKDIHAGGNEAQSWQDISGLQPPPPMEQQPILGAIS